MSSTWDTVREIVCTALEMEPGNRDHYLRDIYRNSPSLRDDIEQLLAAYSKGEEFFDRLEGGLRSPNLDFQSLSGGELVAGRYEVVSFIARGSSGEVYEAWDAEMRESVALKVLRSRWTSERAVEQFRQEIRLSRKIQNPHVCRVHDVGHFVRFDGTPTVFLSMELLRGETLTARLRRAGKLSREEALAILSQVADGLAAAHERGILHRDLKSSNIILTAEPDGGERAVLTDFGLATPSTAIGDELLAGTPAYMAPEQVDRRPLSFATDVYALSVVAFEMLTGRLPFEGSTPGEVAHARLTNKPPSPRSIDPGIDSRWEKVILKGLDPDPLRRFQKPAAMVEALIRRSRKGSIGALLILLLAGAGFGRWYQLRQAAEAPLPGSVLVASFDAPDDQSRTRLAGFREDLMADLAAVPGIRVIALSDGRIITPSVRSLAALRRDFRAATVLTGSIGPDPDAPADQFRVTFSLIDTGSGAYLWKGAQAARIEDLLHIKESVLLGSVRSMHIQLAGSQLEAIEARLPDDSDTYADYLQGSYFLSRRGTDDLQRAIQDFRNVTEKDPQFAMAWARLGQAYNLIANRSVIPATTALKTAEDCATKALALDPNLAEGWLLLGINAHHARWAWDEAEKDFRRGVSLAPGLALGHHWLAGLLSERGHHQDAIREAGIALQLDPLSRSVNNAYWAYRGRARDYDDAIRYYESLLRQQPTYYSAMLGLADVYGWKGHMKEASVLAETVADHDLTADGRRKPYALAELGYFYGRNGAPDKAKAILTELEQRGALPTEIAQVYHGLSMYDETISWLWRGVAAHDEELRVIGISPTYDDLRSNPAFEALERAVGATQ